MSFQIESLPAEKFDDYFSWSAQSLREIDACIETVREGQGVPCRVSLDDAAAGETVLLLNYSHQPAASPYRSRHAIYVRKGVEQLVPEKNEVPKVFHSRMISLRGFDDDHFMQTASVVSGVDVAEEIERQFADSSIAYIHLHYAAPGCFAASVKRVLT